MRRWVIVLASIAGFLIGLGIVALAVVFTPWWYLAIFAIVSAPVLYWVVQARLDRRALAELETREAHEAKN